MQVLQVMTSKQGSCVSAPKWGTPSPPCFLGGAGRQQERQSLALQVGKKTELSAMHPLERFVSDLHSACKPCPQEAQPCFQESCYTLLWVQPHSPISLRPSSLPSMSLPAPWHFILLQSLVADRWGGDRAGSDK